MSRSIQFQEYPIFVTENTEYWEAKMKFRYRKGSHPIWIMIAPLNGRFSFAVDDVAGELTAGDILFVPPNAEFSREILDPLSFFYVTFIDRGTEFLETQRIVKLLSEQYGYKFTTPEQDRLFNNYRQMLNLYGKNASISLKWMTHFVSDIWLLFCREAELLHQNKNTTRDSLMKKAKDRIDQQAFHDDIKMKDIAQLFDLHPVQFTRRFKKAFGMSPSYYLSSVRIENAKLLLIQTDYTLDHIARLCGYSNGFYFSRIFTQYTKMNPSTFRNTHTVQVL